MSATSKVIEAARRVVEQKFDTYKAANGRDVGIQGNNGEKCWIVHSDHMFELETAIKGYDKRKAELKSLAATDG